MPRQMRNNNINNNRMGSILDSHIHRIFRLVHHRHLHRRNRKSDLEIISDMCEIDSTRTITIIITRISEEIDLMEEPMMTLTIILRTTIIIVITINTSSSTNNSNNNNTNNNNSYNSNRNHHNSSRRWEVNS